MKFLRCSLSALLAASALALSGCASTPVTTVQLTPEPQAPLCQPAANALVLWAPQWRPDQKDVREREAAAQDGLGAFLAQPGCFASSVVQRIAQPSADAVAAAARGARVDTVVLVTVRELGPVVKIGGPGGFVEGGTEVVLDLAQFRAPAWSEQRRFTVHWRDGGAGVIKGVATLPADMRSALAAGMQPVVR